MEGVSLSALARKLGRAKSGLHKLAKAKQIPRLADGSFDLGAVQAALSTNLDPARSRVHRSPVHTAEGEQSTDGERSPVPAGFEALADAPNDFIAGAMWMGLHLAYRAGADAAIAAVECGAPAALGPAIRDWANVATALTVEDLLPGSGVLFRPDRFDQLAAPGRPTATPA